MSWAVTSEHNKCKPVLSGLYKCSPERGRNNMNNTNLNAYQNNNISQKTNKDVLEKFLADLAESLQVPDSAYEAAEQRYKSVGTWLSREESKIKLANPIYVQGSFRLGTAIKPVSDEEDYDVDLVCEVDADKNKITQQELKRLVGYEMKAYADKHGMSSPRESKRCWVLDYSEKSQFHLDALPSIPDAIGYNSYLQGKGIAGIKYTDRALAITDNTEPEYKNISPKWPHSNPKGYADWFYDLMGEIYFLYKKKYQIENRLSSVEEVPYYKAKTPLQYAIQILKRHRDITCDVSDTKPISIIITTLAARVYQRENSIYETLNNILTNMEEYIEIRNGVKWVQNPTDPTENFADKWGKYPEREQAFYDWLDKAREDFSMLSQMSDKKDIYEYASPVLGHRLIEKIIRKNDTTIKGASSLLNIFSNPSHKKSLPWTYVETGKVTIVKAQYTRRNNRFISKEFVSEDVIPSGCDLEFSATTDIRGPYQVYWQIVNNGLYARKANQLRGGFEEVNNLYKKENSMYKGTHTIECFIVKGSICVARSSLFFVNIR